MNQKNLSYEIDCKNDESNLISERKRIIIIFSLLLILFLSIIALTITEGFMKIEKYEELARTVENANITTVLGPLMFTGSTYIFIGTCFISLVTIFMKKIDLKIKRILKLSPVFVILFTLPAVLCAFYIVQWFHMI